MLQAMAKEPKKENRDEDKLSRFIEKKTSENKALKKLLAELSKEQQNELKKTNSKKK